MAYPLDPGVTVHYRLALMVLYGEAPVVRLDADAVTLTMAYASIGRQLEQLRCTLSDLIEATKDEEASGSGQ